MLYNKSTIMIADILSVGQKCYKLSNRLQLQNIQKENLP